MSIFIYESGFCIADALGINTSSISGISLTQHKDKIIKLEDNGLVFECGNFPDATDAIRSRYNDMLRYLVTMMNQFEVEGADMTKMMIDIDYIKEEGRLQKVYDYVQSPYFKTCAKASFVTESGYIVLISRDYLFIILKKTGEDTDRHGITFNLVNSVEIRTILEHEIDTNLAIQCFELASLRNLTVGSVSKEAMISLEVNPIDANEYPLSRILTTLNVLFRYYWSVGNPTNKPLPYYRTKRLKKYRPYGKNQIKILLRK